MKTKKALKFCISIIMLCSISYVVYLLINGSYDEEDIPENNVGAGLAPPLQIENVTIVQQTQRELKYIREFKGYDVIAELNIPKIKLNINILQQYSEEALNVSATKFYGPNPNEVGNLCVSGHNYNSRMFKNLSKLSNGDEIDLTDGYNETVKYKVYDVYKVNPNNTSCLSQDTGGRREVTLITCTADSKERIIIKAKET